MVTIKKIAEQAGVSAATVSYVMNNRPDVSDDTRGRVLEIARQMNYTPSRQSKSRRVPDRQVRSLTFVSCMDTDPWGEPYWGQFLSGCLDESHDRAAVLQVAKLDPKEFTPTSVPVSLREKLADGLIVIGWPTQRVMDMLSGLGMPMVLVDTKDVFEGFSHVRPDHAGGTHKSLKHLAELGHRRIGVITGDMSFACESERLAAYYMGMTQLGLPWKDEWIIRQPRMHEDSGIGGMAEVLDRKIDITAVLCHGDMIARGAMKAAQSRGLTIPKDISIIGVDNQAWTSQTTPPLTTVDVALVELGKVAVAHLLERIRNPKLPHQRITVEPKLLVRGTTGPARLSH
jgi:LacI family transcriptional regulator